MNDKIILKKENNVIKEVTVVDSNGKRWNYQPDFINFAELEHEDIIETLECKKEQLTKVLNYSEKKLTEAKKARKIARFCYPLIYIFFFVMIGIVTTNSLSIFSLPIKEILENVCFALVAGGMFHALGAFLFVGNHKDCVRKCAYFKSNLAEVTKDLEEEKAKEIEKSKSEIEFQLKNTRLEELDRKYTRVYGNYYTHLDTSYANVIEIEDEITKEEKPKTIGSKRRK